MHSAGNCKNDFNTFSYAEVLIILNEFYLPGKSAAPTSCNTQVWISCVECQPNAHAGSWKCRVQAEGAGAWPAHSRNLHSSGDTESQRNQWWIQMGCLRKDDDRGKTKKSLESWGARDQGKKEYSQDNPEVHRLRQGREEKWEWFKLWLMLSVRTGDMTMTQQQSANFVHVQGPEFNPQHCNKRINIIH